MIKAMLNNELKGIELYFDEKPSKEVITTLKSDNWRWHNLKKCWYNKQSETTLKTAEQFVNGKIDEVASAEKETKSDAQIEVNGIKVKLGDIFVYSWGYDQTNVDSYQVIGFKGKSTVLLREVANQQLEGSEGFMSCDVQPVKDKFTSDKIVEKRVMPNKYTSQNSIYIKFDNHWATQWDGQEKYYCSWYA